MDEGIEHERVVLQPMFEDQRMDLLALVWEGEGGNGFENGSEGVVVGGDAGSAEQIEEGE